MKDESIEQKKARVQKIIGILKKTYPDAKCTLDFTTPHQLLVAAILAAQCTDERVNQTTPELFKKYPSVEAFANADQAELEEIIKPTGFFRNKAKAIIESARQIVTDYNGRVPDDIDALTKLSGVGRKTANLIVGVAYGQPAVIVDTHVRRVAARLGLTSEKDPTKIEFDLREILPVEEMTHFNHLIVAHGRAICKAPTPLCEQCPVLDLCPYGQQRMSQKRQTEISV
jgi:endonuclease-3